MEWELVKALGRRDEVLRFSAVGTRRGFSISAIVYGA